MAMNEKIKEDIWGAKELIEKKKNDKNLEDYSPYKSTYLWTNEDIKETLKELRIPNKEKALTVLSSGDHLFNLIVDGYSKIDTFDINRLSQYTSLGLKRAMILKYNLEEFKRRIDCIKTNTYTRKEELEEIRNCLDYMEKEHKLFFQSLLDAVARKEILEEDDYLLNYLLKKKPTTTTDLILGNNYLDSDEKYEVLRKRLQKVEISFQEKNILNIDKGNNNYDLVYLSNILDYAYINWGISWNYKNLKMLEKRLKDYLEKDGVIMLHYIFQYYKEVDYYFNNPEIKKKRLRKEELITFQNHYNQTSGILVLRKNLKNKEKYGIIG